jgi:hypothetical protein
MRIPSILLLIPILAMVGMIWWCMFWAINRAVERWITPRLRARREQRVAEIERRHCPTCRDGMSVLDADRQLLCLEHAQQRLRIRKLEGDVLEDDG